MSKTFPGCFQIDTCPRNHYSVRQTHLRNFGESEVPNFHLEQSLIVIPAIDLKDGKCVRLAQGDFSRMTVYSEKPSGDRNTVAGTGAERIHIVDLDGSLAGSPKNRKVILEIVRSVRIPIEVGGGIRDIQAVTPPASRAACSGSYSGQRR